jgi:hypothetical protein
VWRLKEILDECAVCIFGGGVFVFLKRMKEEEKNNKRKKN